MKKTFKNIFFNLLFVLLGNLIFSIAINSVIIPNHLGEGGITGLSLLLLYLFGWNNALVSFVINMFLLVIGWKFLDKKTIIYTVISIVSLSLFLSYVNLGEFIPQNTMMAPLVSGVMVGAAIGIVILGNGTTAGTDIIVLILNKYTGISIPKAFLMLDIFIIVPLSLVIGLEKGAMTVLALMVASRTMTFLLEGQNPKKAVTIISQYHEEIADKLSTVLNRGVTIFNGYGFYTKNEKHIIYIVISQRQLLTLQKIIHTIDPKAFVTISDIHQVVGEGFTFFIDPEVDNSLEGTLAHELE